MKESGIIYWDGFPKTFDGLPLDLFTSQEEKRGNYLDYEERLLLAGMPFNQLECTAAFGKRVVSRRV